FRHAQQSLHRAIHVESGGRQGDAGAELLRLLLGGDDDAVCRLPERDAVALAELRRVRVLRVALQDLVLRAQRLAGRQHLALDRLGGRRWLAHDAAACWRGRPDSSKAASTSASPPSISLSTVRNCSSSPCTSLKRVFPRYSTRSMRRRSDH